MRSEILFPRQEESFGDGTVPWHEILWFTTGRLVPLPRQTLPEAKGSPDEKRVCLRRRRRHGFWGTIYWLVFDYTEYIMADHDKTRRKTPSNREKEELKALFEISHALHRSIQLDELLDYIAFKTRELMGSETVAVILHDPVRDEFFFRCTGGNPEESAAKLKELRFPAGEGIAGSVFRTGKPELITNVEADSRHFKGIDQSTRFRTRSIVAVPLQVKNRIIGVVEACNKEVGEFTQSDLDFLTMIAPTIAMALDNAAMYAELDRAYKELQIIDQAKDHLIDSTRKENVLLRREISGRYRFDQIKGNSPQMMELFLLCEKVINSDISVLIQGETGTGKELIARCLHHNGPRKDRPFITQNCGGIPESLLASELFGYKKGAFTGALFDRKGLFEIANGGTVFLDEVGDMSPAMQVSLLRVLQEGEVKPLGAAESRMVDVRVISATNRDLESDMHEGRFREDLFYRLNAFTIKVPSLRERTGDIPVLTNYFINKFNKKNKMSIKGIDRDALEALCAYSFPGNVRELENEINRAMVLAGNSKTIQLSHLSERIRRRSFPSIAELREGVTLKNMVEELEKSVLLKMIADFNGNKTQIARYLGLSRFGLMKKMKRYGL